VYPDLYQPELREPDRAHATPGSLSRIAAGARRRALRAGDAEVDTGHLLHALLESDDRALGLTAPQAAQSTRLMGYLAQRSIGFGREWRSGEGAGSHRAQERNRLRWSRSAGDALEQASRVALARSGQQADALDLLAQLVADPSCRAVEILCRAGRDPGAVPATGPDHRAGVAARRETDGARPRAQGVVDGVAARLPQPQAIGRDHETRRSVDRQIAAGG